MGGTVGRVCFGVDDVHVGHDLKKGCIGVVGITHVRYKSGGSHALLAFGVLPNIEAGGE